MPRVPHLLDTDLEKATRATVAFEYADGEYLDEAPPLCPRCGNVWFQCDEGLRCVICGKRWRAAACLRRLRSAHDWDRFARMM